MGSPLWTTPSTRNGRAETEKAGSSKAGQELGSERGVQKAQGRLSVGNAGLGGGETKGHAELCVAEQRQEWSRKRGIQLCPVGVGGESSSGLEWRLQRARDWNGDERKGGDDIRQERSVRCAGGISLWSVAGEII